MFPAIRVSNLELIRTITKEVTWMHLQCCSDLSKFLYLEHISHTYFDFKDRGILVLIHKLFEQVRRSLDQESV